jgi:ubiquitin-associated SH3 domain-containing protein
MATRVGPQIIARNASFSATIKRSQDARQVLISMGFPKNRAEKALAATGGNDIQVAADWLLAHVFDDTLDKPTPRDFVVYAIPGGNLGDQLDEFFDVSLNHCGRNGAHKSFPHVTLCQFFKVDDETVPKMCHILHKCIEQALPSAPSKIKLQRYASASYMGLFLEEEHAKWFRQLLSYFEMEMKKIGIVVEPHRKQLHISLAHQFKAKHQAQLEQLMSDISPDTPAKWEIHLYSRDSTQAESDLYRVVYPFTARTDHPDEIDLREGGFVYISTVDNGRTESDGWLRGTSYTTGMTGVFPANYIEKTKESDVWPLHRVWHLYNMKSGESIMNAPVPKTITEEESMREGRLRSESANYQGNEGLFSIQELKKESKQNGEPIYTKVNKVTPIRKPPEGPRKLLIFRHSERVDVTFGKQWIENSFDKQGSYHRRNLNMPKEVPRRLPQEFTKDSPITEMGLFQAQLTGMGLKQQGTYIHNVYCSPALRCVQTADAILEGLQADHTVSIKVENGLFEWLAWCQGELPTFMKVEEFHNFGLRVDTTYKSKVQISDMNIKENCNEFYKRMYNITRLLLKEVGVNGGNVMFVGHAATLEASTRQLVGEQPRQPQAFVKIVQKVPYCGLSMAQEDKSGGWELCNPPIPPLTHGPNVRFDWRLLLD